MKKYCLDCNKEKSQKGSYCRSCGYKHRVRPSGLKYQIKVVNKGWITAGADPWNKGLRGIVKANSGSFKKGEHGSVGTEFRKGNISWSFLNKDQMPRNDNHSQWKGDQVGYIALHFWVKKNLIQPQTCRDCNLPKKLDLSNISGKYLRDLSDWEWLCRSCHKIKDMKKLKSGQRKRAKKVFFEEGRSY